MHCSTTVDPTGPAQKIPLKPRCLLPTFHQSGAEGPLRVDDIEPDTARLSARQGRPRGAILTEPTGAPAQLPSLLPAGSVPSFFAASLSLREGEEGRTHTHARPRCQSTQVPIQTTLAMHTRSDTNVRILNYLRLVFKHQFPQLPHGLLVNSGRCDPVAI